MQFIIMLQPVVPSSCPVAIYVTVSEKRGNFEQNKNYEFLVPHIIDIENAMEFESNQYLIRFQRYSYLKRTAVIHFLCDM